MSSRPIKVSVIVPVYNVKDYLAKSLSSIISQTLKDIEIIAVDDGSTDGSWEVLQEFTQKDKRIITIRQKNRGVSIARNVGITKAHGEYIGFVDADDWIEPGYYKELYATAKKNHLDIVTGYVITENAGRQSFYNLTNKELVRNNKENLKGVVWLNIYKRSLIERHHIRFSPKLRTAEDNLFNLQASYYASKIESVSGHQSRYHHVSREGSLMTQQYDDRNLLQLAKAILETVTQMNLLNRYDKDIYIHRFLDTFNFFYTRLTDPEKLGKITRLKITRTFAQIWRTIKHRDELLKILKNNNEADLSRLIYGKLYVSLYKRYVLGDIPRRKLRDRMKSMMSIKRVVKGILPHGFVVLYKRRLEMMSKMGVSNGKAQLDSKKVAVIVPFRNVKYAELLKSAVEKAGFVAVDSPQDAQYIWLHWYENGINNYGDFLNKITAVKVWKDQGRKIILHVHNKKPHESPVPNISHALMTTLADAADQVVIMSTETKKILKDIWYYGDDFSRVSLVPHPNYINAYGKKQKAPTKLTDDTLKILFFGLVRPYKGIEYLLAATEGMKNVEISIFGKPKDDAYVEKIKELCVGRDNVRFRLEHIPDEDIPSVFASHHLVALPYSKESSLNSGAALLALSYARTVVGTNNGTLKDLESKDLYFGYDYASEEDHARQLKKTIQGIQKKFDGNYNELIQLGERAYESVNKNNSIKVVAQSINEMLKRLK